MKYENKQEFDYKYLLNVSHDIKVCVVKFTNNQ